MSVEIMNLLNRTIQGRYETEQQFKYGAGAPAVTPLNMLVHPTSQYRRDANFAENNNGIFKKKITRDYI